MPTGYTCGPMKSHSRALSATEKPVSLPLISIPQAPSPRETGWLPPAARTASTMICAHAATVSRGASPP